MSFRHSWRVAALLSLSAAVHGSSRLGYLEQTFYFDYNIASQAVPVPVTAQCDTIHLTWSRGAGTGPDPVAPYFLQIYTSAFVFPFIVSAGSGLSFDWAVPFAPGTLYQICMFDKYGMSGGCQGIYTMIANTATTPSCNNATFPLGPLEVDAVVNNGPLSQYGWIDQCTDIQVTPKNGTPPYIFTVAPALHPPHNMTGVDQSAMNWTVSLSWGSPFFISVVDSSMNFWAYGPLHSGQGTSIACLSGSRSNSEMISPATAVASGIGGLLLGLVAGVIAVFVYLRHQRKRRRGQPLLDRTGSNTLSPNPYPLDYFAPASASSSHYKSVPSGHLHDPSSSSSLAMNRLQRDSSNYQIEVFSPPGERQRHSSYGSEYGEPQQHALSPTAGGTGTGGGNIYVVHHDGGRPPVTVYHQEGTEVVELPPRYGTAPAPSNTEGPSENPGTSRGGHDTPISSYSAQDLLTPQRRPNRPGKPPR